MKPSSRLLRQVDPDLKIVSGNHRKKKSASLEDWKNAGGASCPECGQETVRFLNGLCPTCARRVEEESEEQMEDRAMRNYYKDKLKRGTISLSQMRQGGL